MAIVRLPALSQESRDYVTSIIGENVAEMDLDCLQRSQLDELLVVLEAELAHANPSPPVRQAISELAAAIAQRLGPAR